MKILVAMLAAMPAVAGATPIPVLEVVARHHELAGHVIDVDGYLTRCRHLDCAIVASEETARHPRPDAAIVFIAFATERLDRRLDAAAFRHVVLRARVTRRCWDSPCLDRADQIEAIKLIAVSPVKLRKPE
jgi:hypothetical protein